MFLIQTLFEAVIQTLPPERKHSNPSGHPEYPFMRGEGEGVEAGPQSLH